MARTKARERQLKRLAEQRMADRRRRRRQRVAAGIVGGLVAIAGAFFLVRAFLGGEENPEVSETANPNQAAATPKALGGVACNAEVPPGAGKEKPKFKNPPEMQIDLNKSYRVVMRTSCGEIEAELFDDKAPKTVNSFLFLVRKGFYDGLTFHRVIKDFMVQGGDPEGTGMGDPGYKFEDEFVDSLKFDQVGLLAMANSGPGTNGSQFFITVGEASHLNGKHTIFGKVIGGMDVVQTLNALEVDPNDKPTQTAYINEITIIEK